MFIYLLPVLKYMEDSFKILFVQKVEELPEIFLIKVIINCLNAAYFWYLTLFTKYVNLASHDPNCFKVSLD